MSMKLHVVIPPHPLIGHWLSILRIDSTPAPIYSTALEQLGKWLTYEALRDWLPHSKKEINTTKGKTEGILVNYEIPLLVLTNLPGGLQMWQGARELLPNATLCLGEIPKELKPSSGVIILCDQIDTADSLLKKLVKLDAIGIQQNQIRIITSLASNNGLIKIGESFPKLRIFASCIDPEISDNGEIIPGIGNPSLRLNTILTSPH